MIVQDENDNAPEFDQDQFTVTVEENNEPLNIITTLTAVDDDLGSNGEVKYSLGGDDAKDFKIDSVTGEVKILKSLDREEKDRYEMIVVAGSIEVK